MPSTIIFSSLNLGSDSSLASFHDEQRVNLSGGCPFRVVSISKQSVDEPDGSPVRTWPAAFEDARVVKNDDTSRHHKTAPVVPVTLDGGFRMVPIDQEQIDGDIPTTSRFLAEFFDPDDIPPAALTDRSVSGALHEVQSRGAAQMVRVDQIKSGVL